MKKIVGILLLLALIFLVVGYFALIGFANQELKTIAAVQTKDFLSDKNKALALADWIHSPNFTFGKSIHVPELVFFTRVGDCVDFSNIFVIMSNSIGLPARVVATDGEAHSWVEIYSDGRWINLDPYTGTEKSFDNPRYYVDEWTDGNYHKRLSYVYWQDGSGQKRDLTKKYVDTGQLVVMVSENALPAKTRVIVKSHHLMEAIPKDYKTPYVSLVEETNESGIFEKEFGPNTYTVIVEKDILPIFSVVVWRAEKEISLEKGSIETVTFDSDLKFGLQEYASFTVLFLLEVIVLVYLLIQLYGMIKQKRFKTRL